MNEPVVFDTRIIGRIDLISWTCVACGGRQGAKGPGNNETSPDNRWGLSCEFCGVESVLTVIPRFCTVSVKAPEARNG